MSLKLIPPGTRRNKYWNVIGRFNGKFIEGSTGESAKRDAEIFKTKLERKLQDAAASRGQPVTFAYAAEQYKAFRKPKAYDVSRIDRLSDYIGDRLVSDIGQKDMHELAGAIFVDAAPATKNRSILVPLSAVLHFAEANEWRSGIRLKGWKEPKQIARPVSREAAEKFLAVLSKEKQQGDLKRLYTLWILKHGTRAGDTLGVLGSKIDYKQSVFSVYVGKTGEWATFPLDPEVKAALSEMHPRGLPNGRIFHWSKRRLFRWFKRIADSAGVEFTPHMARHAVGTALKDSGAPIRVAMDKLGHKSYKSSLIYQNSDLDTVRKFSAFLPSFSGKSAENVGKSVGNVLEKTKKSGKKGAAKQ